jgi:hypothetical protein
LARIDEALARASTKNDAFLTGQEDTTQQGKQAKCDGGLRENYPASTKVFDEMAQKEVAPLPYPRRPHLDSPANLRPSA